MAMTTDSNELVQGEQPSLQPGTDQHYRLLEQGYHQSAAYAQVVERYPLLRRTIAACRGKGLVRIDGEDAFINRLGRWNNPLAVAKAHAISAQIWSD
jgi:hypothetical protein